MYTIKVGSIIIPGGFAYEVWATPEAIKGTADPSLELSKWANALKPGSVVITISPGFELRRVKMA